MRRHTEIAIISLAALLAGCAGAYWPAASFEANMARLTRGETRSEEVLALFGPPYSKDRYERLNREVWTYRVQASPTPKELYIQFSPDGIVREVYYMDDPRYQRLDPMSRQRSSRSSVFSTLP